MLLFNKSTRHDQRDILRAVRLRQERVAAVIPGNIGSRRLPLYRIRTHGAHGK